MASKVILSENLQEKVHTFPESSMGANKIAVILKNGCIVEDVFVAWGKEIVKVAGKTEIPFAQDDIKDVINRA